MRFSSVAVVLVSVLGLASSLPVVGSSSFVLSIRRLMYEHLGTGRSYRGRCTLPLYLADFDAKDSFVFTA